MFFFRAKVSKFNFTQSSVTWRLIDESKFYFEKRSDYIGMYSYFCCFFLFSSRAVPNVKVGKITSVGEEAGIGWNIAIISDINFKSDDGKFINTSFQCPLFDTSADKYDPAYSAKLRIFGSDVAELNSMVRDEKDNRLLYQSVFTVRLEKMRSGLGGGYEWVLGKDIRDVLNKIDKIKCKIVATRYLFSPVYSIEVTILSKDLLLNYKE